MAEVITGPSGGVPSVPEQAVELAARALCRLHDLDPQWAEALARAALEAAAQVLAEAWNLPQLQAQREGWRLTAEKARKIHDDFWREHEARYPRCDEDGGS